MVLMGEGSPPCYTLSSLVKPICSSRLPRSLAANMIPRDYCLVLVQFACELTPFLSTRATRDRWLGVSKPPRLPTGTLLQGLVVSRTCRGVQVLRGGAFKDLLSTFGRCYTTCPVYLVTRVTREIGNHCMRRSPTLLAGLRAPNNKSRMEDIPSFLPSAPRCRISDTRPGRSWITLHGAGWIMCGTRHRY